MKRVVCIAVVLLLLLVSGRVVPCHAWSPPLTVSGTTPADGAVNVPVDPSIVITFSDTVPWSQIYNNNNIRITITETVSGNAVTLTSSNFSPHTTGSRTQYTITPPTLKYATQYRVTVNKSITGDNTAHMSANYVFSFTTVSPADTTPPYVTPLYPGSGATNVPLDSTITVQFSEPMTEANVTTSTFSLDHGVTGTVTYNSGNNTATFTPSAPLAGNTTFTVTVTTGVTDLAGNHMASNYTWQFTTLVPDNVPPTVQAVNPVNGATSVAVTAPVSIIFSESMAANTITTANISISGVTAAISYNDGTHTATLTPTSNLNYATNYTVTVSTNVTDLAGNHLATAYTWQFTTTQNVTPPDVNEYCQVPPFVAGTSVQPNVLLIIDNSGSMAEFAYKTKGKGGSTGTGADASYNPATLYYGYFDTNQMYKYTTTSGGFFEPDATKVMDKTSFWSGNMLNWLTMRRVDVVRKVLVGGKTQPRSANTANYLIPLENTDRDYYKVYGGVYYRIDDGPTIKVCSSSSCGSITTTYSSKVYVGNDPPQEGLVLQYSDRIRFGIMFFNDDGTRYEDGSNSQRDGGNVAVDIGQTGNDLITQVENTDPSTWTPLAESLYEGVRYFEATTSAYNGGTYSGKDPIQNACQRNFALILSDGESTKDQNLPGGGFNNASGNKSNQVTDAYGFNVHTWMDAIAANEGYASKYTVDPSGSDGSHYLGAVAYYAHNTDLRSGTVNNGGIAGMQNLTIYTVFAFDDSAAGREILQTAAKYGGYEDSNGNGVPDLATEWDKNGDGIPDTYYEANQGNQLESALTTAFNDILTRVSSGTAASILNNSEGSGASLLQAVFYPKKDFDSGTSATWIGELQNLWYYLDPYLQLSTIRVDTVADNKLNLKDDYVANFFFDNTLNQTLVRLSRDLDGTGATMTDLGTYSPDDTANVKSLWRAGRSLWSRNLAPYDPNSNPTGNPRTLYTHTGLGAFDTVQNSLGEATGLASFSTAMDSDATMLSYLRAANSTEADKIITYVTGTDQSGYRPRTVTIGAVNGVWRLGDIVSSTPKIEGNSPLNSFGQKSPTGYNDGSYTKFTGSNQYLNRGMAYAGANDGMLHAFKMGVLKELTDPCRMSGADQNSCRFDKARINNAAGSIATAADRLGNEEWAFIPRQALPYLKFLTDPSYPHLFFVDGTPLVADVSINRPPSGDGTNGTYDPARYPGCAANYWECPRQTVFTKDAGNHDTNDLDLAKTSWRTVIIVGTGLGGASRNRGGDGTCYDSNGSLCVKTPIADLGYSSYFALDVTNPSEPKYLWEFTGDPAAAPAGGNLGFATSGPVVVRVGSNASNGRWFAVFASGPSGPVDATNHQFLAKSDQPLRLFVVDIATGTLVKTITTTITNAFAGSVFNSSLDVDRGNPALSGNYQDDAVYIGYVQKNGTTSNWNSGGVIRLLTRESVDPNDATNPWTWSSVISGIGPVTSSVAKLQDRGNNKLWLYFGTGRYFYKNASTIDDADPGRFLYAIQEPCYTPANRLDSACTASVATTDIKDQTTAPSPALASSYKGWSIALDTSALNDGYASERVITDPVASPSGVVFFTTFRPTSDVCGYGGSSYIWALNYGTGGAPPTNAMQGKLMLQVSTGAFAEVSMATGFGAKEGRRTTSAVQGVPPKAQGLSLLTNPRPIKKVLHIQER